MPRRRTTSPSFTSSVPPMIRSSVDLPAPFGPMIPIRAPSGTMRSTPWSTGQVPYDLCTPTRLTTDISATKRTEPLGRRLERLQRLEEPIDGPDQSLEATELRRILPEPTSTIQGLADPPVAGEPQLFEGGMSPGRHQVLRGGEPLLQLEDPLCERCPRGTGRRNGSRHRLLRRLDPRHDHSEPLQRLEQSFRESLPAEHLNDHV